MEETKTIYFWTTGEKFDIGDIDRIYDEMKYNYYSSSNLANGLAESDYGAITNMDFDKAKEFAKRKVQNLDKNNSFCYLIEQEITLSVEMWKDIIDENGVINITKLGTDKYPEFKEPTYSILIKDGKQNDLFEEDTIHIKPQEELDPTVLNLVISNFSEKSKQLLGYLYSFANKTGMFDERFSKDYSKLNKAIRQNNQNKATKIQVLDKLGKSMEYVIPLKILCYIISDAMLILGRKKEISDKIQKEIEVEKEQMIKSVRNYAKEKGLDIEDIFDKEGNLKPRSETIDNPNFSINKDIDRALEKTGRNSLMLPIGEEVKQEKEEMNQIR